MISGIYAILNLVNSKLYIGSTKNFYKRWGVHKSTLRNNKHDNEHLQKSFNKYRQINFIFVIIEHTVDLEIREQFYLDTLKPEYNMKPTAYNMTGYKHKEETKLKISKIKTGKTHSVEAKLNMSRASGNRNEEKWPHKDKAKCKCPECKAKWTLRDKLHMREWRAANREANNAYMREYNKKRKLKAQNSL